MNGSRTPRRSRLARRRRPASTARRSSLADLTGGVPREARITGRGRTTVVLGALAGVVVLTLIASLAVIPWRTYGEQGDRIDELADQLARLEAVNADLSAEVQRLRTDDGVREAARDELGYVADGEDRETVMDAPPLPTDLPNGWPYGVMADIIAARTPSP